jgi:hypothetical protein
MPADLVQRIALIVEGNNPFSRSRHFNSDEAEAPDTARRYASRVIIRRSSSSFLPDGCSWHVPDVSRSAPRGCDERRHAIPGPPKAVRIRDLLADHRPRRGLLDPLTGHTSGRPRVIARADASGGYAW